MIPVNDAKSGFFRLRRPFPSPFVCPPLNFLLSLFYISNSTFLVYESSHPVRAKKQTSRNRRKLQLKQKFSKNFAKIPQ